MSSSPPFSLGQKVVVVESLGHGSAKDTPLSFRFLRLPDIQVVGKAVTSTWREDDDGNDSSDEGGAVTGRSTTGQQAAPPARIFAVRGKDLLEVSRIGSEYPKSFFVGDSVERDGRIVTLTPFNPAYFFLPALEATARDRFVDLPTILSGGLEPLMEVDLAPLALVSDVKDVAGEDYYRLNEAKALAWLGGKVRALVAHLEADDTANDVANEGHAAIFKRSSKARPQDTSGLFRASVGIVGEYLNDSWRARLAAAMAGAGAPHPDGSTAAAAAAAAVSDAGGAPLSTDHPLSTPCKSWDPCAPGTQVAGTPNSAVPETPAPSSLATETFGFANGRPVRSAIAGDFGSSTPAAPAKRPGGLNATQSVANKRLAQSSVKGLQGIASFFKK